MLDCVYMVVEKEEIQDEEEDCVTHDGQVARRLTDEGEVSSKCFRRKLTLRNGKVGAVGPAQ